MPSQQYFLDTNEVSGNPVKRLEGESDRPRSALYPAAFFLLIGLGVYQRLSGLTEYEAGRIKLF